MSAAARSSSACADVCVHVSVWFAVWKVISGTWPGKTRSSHHEHVHCSVMVLQAHECMSAAALPVLASTQEGE